MSYDMKAAGEYVGVLFLLRDMAHKEHLKVAGPGSHAKHKALNEFYSGILDHADTFAEVWQGFAGQRLSIPRLEDSSMEDPGEMEGEAMDEDEAPVKAGKDFATTLRSYLGWIDAERDTFTSNDKTLQNMVDNVRELIGATLYLLTLE